MNARTLSQALLPFATLALCGSIAFAQQTATPAAPPTPDTPAADTQAPPAPVERQTPRVPRPPRPPRPPRVRVEGHPQMGPMMHEHEMRSNFRTGPMGFGMERKWWTDSALAQQLNLTPDQLKRMDTIFEQSKLQLIDVRANLQKQEVLLEPLLSANPVDMGKAKAQIEKVARARADLEIASSAMLLGIRGVLTPDQWTKLNERHERHGFIFRRGGPDQPEGPGSPGSPGAPPPPPAGGR